MTNVATRLLSMIFLFQSRGHWTVSELSRQLEVSDRTVHRYLDMLEEMGIPLYAERGPYGGFSLLKTYKLPPLIFTAEEATVLYMGAHLMRDIWGKTFKDAVTGVTAKLDNVLPDDLREQVRHQQRSLVVTTHTARNYAPYQEMMHTLRLSMMNQKQVRLTYTNFSRTQSDRVVDPYALSFRDGYWYLVGFCHLRQELRTFRVDRIRAVELLADGFNLPQDFDARTHLDEMMRFEDKYEAVVRIDATRANEMHDQANEWMRVSDEEDGSVTTRFWVDNLNWTCNWVLGWGKSARVLAPPELIEKVKDAAEGILAQY